jgi:Fe-S cluster assembly protein SufB
VVEVIIHKDAEVKYSTVQNWFPGDGNTGGILNFVTKRALCEGENSKMSWTSRKPARPLPGNTRAAFCAGITPSVSFTRWR